MNENNSPPDARRTFLGVGIILGFLALLASFAIPNFVNRGSQGPMRNFCINNLRQLDAAKQQWAMETGKTNSDAVATWGEIKFYVGRGLSNSLDEIYCPQDKTRSYSNSYILGDLKTRPRCKINPPHLLP